MPTSKELEAKFWKALNSDRTMMLGLVGVNDGHAQPMTGMTMGANGKHAEHGPIWFFTSKDNGLVAALSQGSRGMAHFTSKGHDLFATIHGNLGIEQDRGMIEKLWNPWVAAWFEGGKTDPKVELLRLDTESAEIWENENSLLAGVKMALGLDDPKEEYKDKVAEVSLT